MQASDATAGEAAIAVSRVPGRRRLDPFAAASTVVSLLATTVAAPRREQRDRRWTLSTVTMLCATSPLLWMLVGAPSF